MAITVEKARALFKYDASTGEITWRTSPNNRIKQGAVAGSFDKRGYRKIKVDNQDYRAHWIIWLIVYGRFPSEEIDHINHVKDDNRIINLREICRKGNARNLSVSSRNKSGVVGVHKRKENGKWRAAICVDRKSIYLGEFISREDAISARSEANRKYGFHANHGASGTSAGP